MSGLILKDILVLRKTLRSYVFFLLFYLFMAILGLFSISFVTSFIQVIVMILPISAFAYDEQTKWDRYAMTLPLGRRRVVTARYLFVLLAIVSAALFALVSCILLSILQKGLLMENLTTASVALGLGLLVADLNLPMSYAMGPERARPYLYATIFIPFLALVGAAKLGWLDFLDHVSPPAIIALSAFIPLLPLLGFPISYLVSCRVVEQKEY
ncbi:MAG: ABC-2 transporter permease [Lawsonibacter sp.]|jgi:ABC-2 type transport system permease protein